MRVKIYEMMKDVFIEEASKKKRGYKMIRNMKSENEA